MVPQPSRESVGVEVVRFLEPLTQLIIDLFCAGQVDHVDNAMGTGRHPSRDPRILDPARVERALAAPSARAVGLGDLAIALQKDADIDCIFVYRTQAARPFQHSRVDFSDPRRMPRKQLVNSDPRDADVGLVDLAEFTFAARTSPSSLSTSEPNRRRFRTATSV